MLSKLTLQRTFAYLNIMDQFNVHRLETTDESNRKSYSYCACFLGHEQ